jgi:hypothetical protein
VAELIDIDEECFDPDIEHFQFPDQRQIGDVTSLQGLEQFSKLTSASFHATNLNDEGLAYVCQVATLETLDLRDTAITDAGLVSLAQLPRLKHLRLEDNLQLTDECAPYLSELRALVDLHIQETSLSEVGLVQLHALSRLREVRLTVWDGNYSFGGLLGFSQRMPACTFVARGSGEFRAGHFEGHWGVK